MSKILNKDSIRNIVIALMTVAISYLFLSISEMQKTIFKGQEHDKSIEENQEKMSKQWRYITENRLGIRDNKTNIEWLIKFSK